MNNIRVGCIDLNNNLKLRLSKELPNIVFCDIKNIKQKLFNVIVCGRELKGEEETFYNIFKCNIIYTYNSSIMNTIEMINRALKNPICFSNTEIKYIGVVNKFQYLNEKVETLIDGNNNHSMKVAAMMYNILTKLNIEYEKVLDVYIASLMHDIGKVYINPNYLSKKGKLTKNEYEEVKTHATKGYEVMDGYLSEDVRLIIKDHHRRENGGYPIENRETSQWSKLLALVDSYDAMVSHRVYNIPLSHKDSINEIIMCTKNIEDGGKGIIFNPYLSSLFIKMVC